MGDSPIIHQEVDMPELQSRLSRLMEAEEILNREYVSKELREWALKQKEQVQKELDELSTARRKRDSKYFKEVCHD